MPRRRALTWLISLLAVGLFITLAFFLASNARVKVNLASDEATASVALGELKCQKTFKQAFPFFEMTCTETAQTDESEVEQTKVVP